jgi:hypothetical protein
VCIYDQVNVCFIKFDGTVFFDQHSSEDSPTEPAEAVVDSFEEGLGRRPKLGSRVVRDERAARGPHGGVGDTWKEVKLNNFN